MHQIKPQLDKMESDRSIERWHIDLNSSEFLLEVETDKLSAEEVKNFIRNQGFEADVTKTPQSH